MGLCSSDDLKPSQPHASKPVGVQVSLQGSRLPCRDLLTRAATVAAPSEHKACSVMLRQGKRMLEGLPQNLVLQPGKPTRLFCLQLIREI